MQGKVLYIEMRMPTSERSLRLSRSHQPLLAIVSDLATWLLYTHTIRRSSSWWRKVVSDANLARFTWHVPKKNPATVPSSHSHKVSPALRAHHPAASIRSRSRTSTHPPPTANLVRCLADRARSGSSSLSLLCIFSFLSFSS